MSAAGSRIYWLTDEFYPPEIGGVGVMASSLARGLAACGIEIHVITRQTQPPAASRERLGQVDVRRIRPAGRLKGAGWRAIPAVLHQLARLSFLMIREARRYDGVIVSGMKIIPLVAVPICRLLGKYCVIRVESPFEVFEPVSAESLGSMKGMLARAIPPLLRGVQQWILRRASAVIAISAEMETVLRGCGVAVERIAMIPNAIELARFAPLAAPERAALRRRLGLPPQATIVLYTGRLSRAKGVASLIHAWKELAGRHPGLFLVMVGSGHGSWDDCEDEIVALVRSNELEPHVALIGRSDRVHEYVQVADLFVSPSDYEGFGLALVEALAGAVPAVSTAVGIAPQVIRDGINGFLCPPMNLQALTDALERALAARDHWAQIGQLGSQAVRRYDLRDISEQYAKLAQVLGTKRPLAT